jgi:transcriptional regulator with XRE-family HTH domain
MIDKPTKIKDLPEDAVEFSRARYRNEIAHAIYEQMKAKKVGREHLAALMGWHHDRIKQILAGEENVRAETLADIMLVLGCAPRITLDGDIDTVKLPQAADND